MTIRVFIICKTIQTYDSRVLLTINLTKSFIKLAKVTQLLQQMILGPFLTNGDMESNIHEVFTSWHLGMEEDPSWQRSVINQVPNLYTMASVDASGRSGGRHLYRLIS